MLANVHAAAKGEAAWPPLAMVKALLLSIWYDLSDVKLAEALDDRASFRRFCGFSKTEATPERTAFVRFRRALIVHDLDRCLFALVTAQLTAKAITIKTGTIVDATIIASASKDDGEARWVKHRNKKAVHGFKAHVGADADTALIEEVVITPANINDGKAGSAALGSPERCVHVGDRESDIYELYRLTQDLGAHFVVRACVDRLAGDGEHTIADEMEETRVKDLHHVELRDEKGETTKVALEIRFKRISVLPPIGDPRTIRRS